MKQILTKTIRNKGRAVRNFSSFAQSAHGHSYREYPELDQSYMKIVGGDVDTFSADYQENYEKMQLLNSELDGIVSKTLDVGQRQRELSSKRDKLLPRERIN